MTALLTLVLVGATLVGTTPIQLNEVRRQSRENISVQRAVLQRALAQSSVQSSRGGLLPQLSLNGGAAAHYSGPQRVFSTVPTAEGGSVTFEQSTVDVPASSRGAFDLTLALTQLLFDGAKVWNRYRGAQEQLDAETSRVNEALLVADYEGQRRFYELFRAEQRMALLEGNVARSERQVSRVEALFESGRSSRADVLAAQVNVGNDKLSVLAQQVRLSRAEADLSTWLGRGGMSALSAVAPDLSPASRPLPAESPEQTLARAKEHRPLLRALISEQRAAEAQVREIRGTYWPAVALQGRVGRSAPAADPFFTDPTRQNEASGGLTLRWLLFDGLATQAQVDSAQATARLRVAELTQAQAELEAQLRDALRTLAAQRKAVEVVAQNEQLALASLQVSEQRYQSGSSSLLEWRDAQLKLVEAQLNLLESRVDAAVAAAAVERLTGTLEEIQP